MKKIKNFRKSFLDNSILHILNGKNIEDEVYLIMPYLEHDNFLDIFVLMNIEEIKIYMFKLLDCLEKIHSINVVHRDIKPENFLYNRKKKKCLLIDFGLSDVV